MLKRLLYINLFSITFLSLFNYLVFHNLNGKAYLEGFTAYNQKITNLAFQNIDKDIMEAVAEIPQIYFSDIRQNEDILLPQEENIIGNPARIRGLNHQTEEIRKTYSRVESLDIYYEGTGTVVTRFSQLHDAGTEKLVDQYLPWYDEFRKMGKNTAFFESSNGIYPLGRAAENQKN